MKTPSDLRKWINSMGEGPETVEANIDDEVYSFLHGYGDPTFREMIYQDVIKRLANDNKYKAVLHQVISEYIGNKNVNT